MKSILVTGACGFIGSYVVRALLAGGSRVLAVDHGKDMRLPAVQRVCRPRGSARRTLI